MTIRILKGDCREILKTLPNDSVHCCVTSPPYFGLRDYGVDGQIGLEPTPDAYVAEMAAVFREVRRVLCDDGTLWLNIGDSYASVNRGENARPRIETLTGIQAANPYSDIRTRKEVILGQKACGIKPKDLIGIPWLLAFALRADGWYLRQDIIWSKPNPMPESVTDRCTKAHEYIFMLSKSAKYHYDADAIAEPAVYAGDSRNLRTDNTQIEREVPKQNGHGRRYEGFNSRYFTGKPQAETRNKRSVWEIATQPYSEAHFATFPPALIEPCIMAGCPVGGTVLDPFGGAGTTGMVVDRLGRNAVLIELNPDYAAMAENRIIDDAGMFAQITT